MIKKVIIGIFAILLIVYGGVKIYYFIESTIPDDGSDRREQIEYLNNEVDLSLLVYGDDIDFPEELEYEKINSLESINWQRDNDYVYLIINDLNGHVTFEKEKYLELVAYADQNTNFNFYYIGTDDLDMIQKNTKDCDLDDEDMSFGYIVYEGERVTHYGLWSKSDHKYLEINPDLFNYCVYTGILADIKTNEEEQ